LLVRLLGDWRSAVRSTVRTRAGTTERNDAERTERRARWAYEDESRNQDADVGIYESPTATINRLDSRNATLRRDLADIDGRSARLADEREIRHELSED
jgi:hypothetical protein